jgi:hypothetical protein
MRFQLSIESSSCVERKYHSQFTNFEIVEAIFSIVARERVRKYTYARHTCTEYVQLFQAYMFRIHFLSKFELENTAIPGPTEHLTLKSESLVNTLLVHSSIWPSINVLRSKHALRIENLSYSEYVYASTYAHDVFPRVLLRFGHVQCNYVLQVIS